MLQLQKVLKEQVNDLTEQKKSHLEELCALLDQDKQLAEQLGMPVSKLNRNMIPSSNDLKDLQINITSLENELVKRQKQFRILKQKCEDIIEEIEGTVDDDFTSSFLYDSEEYFIFSKQNLELCEVCTLRYIFPSCLPNPSDSSTDTG